MPDPAEIPVAIEDKRYQTGSLDLRDLEGELAAATRTYPDIQLWCLPQQLSCPWGTMMDEHGQR